MIYSEFVKVSLRHPNRNDGRADNVTDDALEIKSFRLSETRFSWFGLVVRILAKPSPSPSPLSMCISETDLSFSILLNIFPAE